MVSELSDVPTRRLSPKGRWTRGSVVARMLGLQLGGLGDPTTIE